MKTISLAEYNKIMDKIFKDIDLEDREKLIKALEEASKYKIKEDK